MQRALDIVERHAKVVDGTGEAKYGPHALGHFFAARCIERGLSPKRLQALMGHGSIKMACDVYGHLFSNLEDVHQRFAAGEIAVPGARPHN